MLGRERLCGRHQRPLAAGLDRPHERVRRHGRLARADVALQQAPHRHGPFQVDVDLADRPALGAGEVERQGGDEGRRQVARRRERPGAGLGLEPRPAPEEAELEEMELVVGQAPPGGPGLRQVARLMARVQRVAAKRQRTAGLHAVGQRVDLVAGMGERVGNELDEPSARHALGRRVDGHEPGRVQRLAVVRGPLVALDDDLGADRRAPLAAEREPHPGLQVLGEVALVEPDRDARAGLVADRRLDDGQVSPPRRSQPHPLDRAHHGRLLPGPISARRRPERKSSCRNGTCSSRSPTVSTGRGRRAASASARARREVAGRSRCSGLGADRGRGKPGLGRRGAPERPRHSPARTSIPSVPGPPWVPTTAPISQTRSIEASGRARCTISAQALEPGVVVGVRQADPRRAPVGHGGAQEPVELAHRGGPPERALVWLDLAPPERQQRPHAERAADHLRRAPDPAAAAQVLERVHVDQHRHPIAGRREPGRDLVHVGAGVEQALDALRQEHRAGRHREPVEDGHAAAGLWRVGRDPGSLGRRRHLRRDRQDEDMGEVGQLLESGGVGTRGRGGRGGMRAAGAEAVVERRRRRCRSRRGTARRRSGR